MARHLPHTRIDRDIVGKRVLAYPDYSRGNIPLRIRGTAFRREIIHNTSLVWLRNCSLPVNHRTNNRLIDGKFDFEPLGIGVDGTVIWDVVEHKAGRLALPTGVQSGFGRGRNGWKVAVYDARTGPAFYIDECEFITECDEAILDYTGEGCELWVKGWR